MSFNQPAQPLSLELADETKSEMILSVYALAPSYFLNVEGKLPDISMVLSDLNELPPAEKRTSSTRKEDFILKQGDEDIGFIEICLDYPAKDTAYIGLLLLKESVQKKGVGREAFQLLENRLKGQGIRSLYLSVADPNPVHDFWKKMGFALTSKRVRLQRANQEVWVQEMVKDLLAGK